MYAVIQRARGLGPASTGITAGTWSEKGSGDCSGGGHNHPQSLPVQSLELGTTTVKDIIAGIRGVTSFNINL